jgi:hypothetical protein
MMLHTGVLDRQRTITYLTFLIYLRASVSVWDCVLRRHGGFILNFFILPYFFLLHGFRQLLGRPSAGTCQIFKRPNIDGEKRI